jgi:biopolymer transport protein ExbB/TolQ
MHRFLVAGSVVVSILLLALALAAQDFEHEIHQVKERQKAEMKALQLKHKYAKDSMKGQQVSKATKSQMLNEMKREEQALKLKHQQEMESLKDRMRVLRESQGG